MRWRAVLVLATAMAVALVGVGGLAWAASGDTVADRVLGQVDFTSKLCNKGANQPGPGRLCAPSDAAVNPSGRLFVTDTGNNRVLSWPSASSFTNGEQADLVIGQADFTSGKCNKNTNQPSAAKLCQPYDVAVDSAGNLYVADQENSRVLQYMPPLATNMQASKVLGQTNFTSREANQGRSAPSSHTLFRPFGVVADGSGNLYVADFKNHRVLEYDAPLTSGMAAARVFGQGGSFATNSCNKGGVSASSLCFPTEVAVDSGGNLYAVDSGNNRMLGYNAPLTIDTTADQVFGQGGSFLSNTCNNGGVSASSLCGAEGVGVDGADNLYVGDYANNRVLGYDDPIP